MGNEAASEVLLLDCLKGMKLYLDKYFELAIVDPPYGGGQHFNFRYGTGDQVYENRRPDLEYFHELSRVSKHQIVWGGNYFTDMLPVSRCWLSWSKSNPAPNFSDFELAWTSIDKVCQELRLDSYGFNHADKRLDGQKTIHPTQKPVALYKWLLKNYAKDGDKILDTHMGSQSSRIAAWDMGFDYYGFEIDADYFKAGCERFENHKAQLKLFQPSR
jgi:site-specific DNA-methyltransferase (adenine-specific)